MSKKELIEFKREEVIISMKSKGIDLIREVSRVEEVVKNALEDAEALKDKGEFNVSSFNPIIVGDYINSYSKSYKDKTVECEEVDLFRDGKFRTKKELVDVEKLSELLKESREIGKFISVNSLSNTTLFYIYGRSTMSQKEALTKIVHSSLNELFILNKFYTFSQTISCTAVKMFMDEKITMEDLANLTANKC